MLITLFWVSPHSFLARHGALAAWGTISLIALAAAFLIALIELAMNAFAPRRGRFGKREPRSIFDCWPLF